MTKEEFEKLKETVHFFRQWYSGDYIFMTNNPLPNQDAEEIGRMEVKCFYTFEENGKNPVLTINVGEYN